MLCLSHFISLRPFSSPNASSILKYCLLWNSGPFSLWNSFFVSTFYSLSCASCSMLDILYILLISYVNFFPKRILARLQVSSSIPALNWRFSIFRQKKYLEYCIYISLSCKSFFMSEVHVWVLTNLSFLPWTPYLFLYCQSNSVVQCCSDSKVESRLYFLLYLVTKKSFQLLKNINNIN